MINGKNKEKHWCGTWKNTSTMDIHTILQYLSLLASTCFLGVNSFWSQILSLSQVAGWTHLSWHVDTEIVLLSDGQFTCPVPDGMRCPGMGQINDMRVFIRRLQFCIRTRNGDITTPRLLKAAINILASGFCDGLSQSPQRNCGKGSIGDVYSCWVLYCSFL